MNKTIIFTLLTAGIVGTTFASSVVASGYGVNCQPMYGGYSSNCKPSTISVNKTVQNPVTKNYVDNLGVNEEKYAPDATVPFRIVVTNSGSKTLKTITVKDVLPAYLSYEGSAGKYDASARTLTFSIDTLNVNESKTFEVATKVVGSNSLPNDQGITCVVNKAVVSTSDISSEDNSQVCIEKSVQTTTTKGGNPVYPAPTTVKTTPKTGPESILLFGLIPAGAGGFLLRRRSN